MTMPFNVEAEDINRLSDIQLTKLLNILLIAEANKSIIPLNSTAVALNITVGDGGEDGRIEWQEGPAHTDFIPNRLTQFQNKATDMGPTDYGNEIVTATNQLKPIVLDVLTKGGSYIVFTTQELNAKQKIQRLKKMRAKLTELNLPFADTADLRIYDASQISNWVNQYLSAIINVLSWLGRSLVRGLKTFHTWSQTRDLTAYPYIEIPSRATQLNNLKSNLKNPRFCARIKGLSGLGKTRSTFELFNQDASLQKLVVYIDAAITESVAALINDWIVHGMTGIIVVDNCDNELHIKIQNEVERGDSKLSFLSLDYNLEKVSTTHEIQLHPLEDDEIRQMLAPVYGDKIVDLERIAKFAQGFPKMAVLLADARLNLSADFGSLNDEALANKLLWGSTGTRNEKDELILKGCALFDRFGCSAELSLEGQYISSKLQNVTHDDFHDCVTRFTERGLIDRRGRYGQLVPKPLAIRLAAQWWRRTTPKVQQDLISTIPDSMLVSFCDQIEKLDFLPEVKQLTQDICGPQGPFGQAEVILSVRGSRLFRSFVNVNPEATADAIYNVLTTFSDEQLTNIGGDVRRNLVWGLEKLCFHKEQFIKGATCLLLLASCENEDWSNNSTGMFAQLFKVWLSGTEAEPNLRVSLLKWAYQQNKESFDRVILGALEGTFNIYHNSRTVGAEYQGSKPPLIEWQPKIWQEVFDYWDACIDLLLEYSDYPDPIGDDARRHLGENIRPIFSRGRIESVERIIKHVTSKHGPYWPQAISSLNDVRQFDSKGMPQEGFAALDRFIKLLTPDQNDLQSLLKLFIIEPHSDYEEAPNGQFVDKTGEKAQQFAESLDQDYELLWPYIALLSTGDQRYTYHLGRTIMSDTEKAHSFLVVAITVLSEIDKPDPSLVYGLLSKLYVLNPEKWEEYLEVFFITEKLQRFFAGMLRTGEIKAKYLALLLELIKNQKVPEHSATNLIYSEDYTTITSSEIGHFASELAIVSAAGAWAAFDLLTMYSFSNENRFNGIRDSILSIVTKVSLNKEDLKSKRDLYSWGKTVLSLIDSEPVEFSTQIANQIIAATKHDMDHGLVWDHIRKIVGKLLEKYPEKIWPLFASEIINTKPNDLYWLGQIFKRENSFNHKYESILNKVPAEIVIAWCNENPDVAPRFVASCINIFDVPHDEENNAISDEPPSSPKHPSELLVRLLENFGHIKSVTSTLGANMSSRAWGGSLVPYLESDVQGLSELINHKNPNVSTWARNQVSYLKNAIEVEKMRDQEEKFRY